MTPHVKGTLDFNNANGSDATINVLSGGKLIAKNHTEVFGDTKVSNWGKIEFPANQKEYIIKNTFLSECWGFKYKRTRFENGRRLSALCQKRPLC